MGDIDVEAIKARTEVVTNAIARALCDQEERADESGDQAWWGWPTDDVAEFCAIAALDSATAEVTRLRSVVAGVEALADEMDDDARYLRAIGCDGIARRLRSVLSDTRQEQQ